ncbi:MAG TPA: hypothetical protein VFN23_21350, partial [Ktedonobacteraceae bacterium]|nr:hypothetical protein [Ktedonobacteraceae bacterium]
PLGEIWKLYTRSLDTPIQTWLNAPRRLLRSFTYTRQQRKLAQVVLNKPAFDYGAETSLRQVASDIKHHLFFQEIDQSMYLKVAQKQILETVSNFLEEHHINTDEFRQRQQMLLNSGIINTGTISNSNLIGSVSDAQVAMSVASAIQPAAPGLQA